MNPESIDEELGSWNNIYDQLKTIARDVNIPVKGKKEANVTFRLSVLKTDAGVDEPQCLHTDDFKQFEFSDDSKEFGLVSITAVSDDCFLYVTPFMDRTILVLLNRGDTILVRTDIPHAGTENLVKHDNYRLHAFWNVEQWSLKEDDGFTVKKVDFKTYPTIKWSDDFQEFTIER